MTTRPATAACLLLLACSPAFAAGTAVRATPTETTTTGEIGTAAIVLHPTDPARHRVVASAALGGLELYDLDGRRLATVPAGEATAVAVGYGPRADAPDEPVIATVDITDQRLRLFALADDRFTEVGDDGMRLGFAGEGLCAWRNPLDAALYLFVVGDGGEIEQRLVHATDAGRLGTRVVRRISVPSTVKQCVVSAEGQLYAAEEAVGIWRLTADPEADVAATLVDSARGHLAGEVGGVALVEGGDGHRWLLASDSEAGRIAVYDRDRDDAFVGAFPVAAGDATIEEPGPLFATTHPLGGGFASGVLLVADEDADGGGDAKLVPIAAVADALSLPVGVAHDPRRTPTAPVPAVAPLYETAPVPSFGDAADDPAIWAHPTDPARSLIVATDKKGGMVVYDMQGRQVQYRTDGKMNNVDLRDGFVLDGQPVTIVAASDRTRKAIALYRLDGEARELVDIAAGVQATGLEDPYGLCLYRSAKTAKTYVFINSGDGPLHQWELVDAGDGRVRAELVRKLAFESQTEGCVADDATGTLYIGEEDVALWKLPAEPDGGDAMTAVDRVDANDRIAADLEGVGLYDLGDGRGYLVVSSQGNDTYAVYRREGRQEYLGSFAVASDGARGIDGISETDGLDVSSANLGPGLEHGAMVAQDGRNVLPVENQNYKIVPWSAIAEALGLETRPE